MRRKVWISLFGIAVATGCGSSPDATIVVPDDAPAQPSSTVAAGLSTAPRTSSITIVATVSTTSTTDNAAASTVVTTAAPPPPPANPPPAKPAPAATTAPAAAAPAPTTSTPRASGGALVPAFFAFDVSIPVPCAAGVGGATPEVTLRWEVIGTETVDVSVGSVDAVYRAGLSPAGTLTVPYECPGPRTYFVVAENADGRSVMKATR